MISGLVLTEEYQSPNAIKLVAFDDMRARLGDGYLIKSLIGSGTMAVLYGESGTGKTFFALHLALCVAAGLPFFQRRVRQTGVIYVAAEAGASIENRVAAAKQEIEFPETMPFAAIESPIYLCTAEADTDRMITAVRSADLGSPIELIVIDTLSRVMAGGNENQPDDMGAFVRNLDRIRAETGAAILVVHHSGKDASRGARGHSLLRAATDTEIEVTRDEASKVATARVTKQREYATDGTLSFALRQVELGIDQDGDPITSCVVEPADANDRQQAGNTKRLTDGAKIGLAILHKAINEAGVEPPASNHIPAGTPTVDVETWRKFYYAGTASDGLTGEARKKNFQRVRQQLQAALAIGIHTDQCWAISKT